MLLEDSPEAPVSPEILGGRALVSAVLRQAVQDLTMPPVEGHRKNSTEATRASARNFLRSQIAKQCAAELGIMPGTYRLLLAKNGLL